MSGTVPPKWGAGGQWSPAADPRAEVEWSGTLPTSGEPTCFVAIGGHLQAGLRTATWTLGRDSWFDVLAPRTASFSFVGAVTGDLNDRVAVVTTDSGSMWVGRVDAISTDNAVADASVERTSVSATDDVGAIGRAMMDRSGDVYTGFTLDELVPFVMALAGLVPPVVTVADSATPLPALDNSLDAHEMRMLDYLNLAERSSNAMMFLNADGGLTMVTRDAVVAGTVTVIDLTGDDSPSTWGTTRDRTDIINHWTLIRPEADSSTIVLDEFDLDSEAAYGEFAYRIDDYLDSSAAHFPSAMRDAIAQPRTRVTGADFPIVDIGQDVLRLAPLDWVRYGGDAFQVMSVTHSVDVGSSWRMTMAADVSQNAMAGAAEPTLDLI